MLLRILSSSLSSTSHWDGVRNALAKRYMKEDMKLGDKVDLKIG